MIGLMGQGAGKQHQNHQSGSSSRHGSSSTNPPSSEDEADSSNPASPTTKYEKLKKGGSKNKKMPLFRKQSEKARRRSEHQQYLAQENPEPIFDLSHCELETVPSGVLPLCKVLQKEVLLLNDNWLHSLGDGTKLSDLRTVRVLDLHNNEIKHLPSDLGELESIQVLNLENNKISKFTSSMKTLKHLQTLNLRGNRLKALPDSICDLPCLRNLDISENEITSIPKLLCNVRTLETLTLDAEQMKYPCQDICSKGTEEIMKFLCSECGMEYLPPSNFLLNVLDPPKSFATSLNSMASKAYQAEEENLKRKVEDYSNMMDKKKQERVELERQLAEHQHEQTLLAMYAGQNREKLITDIAQEESHLEKELVNLTQKKERERKRLFKDLQAVEEDAENLIRKILEVNKKSKKTEELLEEMEREREHKDLWFVVRWEEIENLRKKDVLNAMQEALKETDNFEILRQSYTANKGHIMRNALESEEMTQSSQVESVLSYKEAEQAALRDVLAKQEQWQKEAFEALQLQKDARHQRISSQILLIQEELATLTLVEIERREMKTEEEINRLAEKRIALIDLLSQLMFERERRQTELRKRLEEMEQLREDGQKDYWLVQYQRLMDRKPQALIDQEHQLEISVVKILERSLASDYIPMFARHRISIETLLWMSEEDLIQMGVHEMGIRKNIQRNLEIYLEEEKLNNAQPPQQEGASEWPGVQPSAPPLEAARQTSVHARGLNSECSICLDRTSAVIFLNCGHVCCCIPCSDLVQQCPLCRAEVFRRIRIEYSNTESEEA